MRAYRLHRARRAASEYTGSLLYPGRWHPKGTPMLYFSPALSLACLEQLVHLGPKQVPDDYAFTSIELRAEPEIADFRGSLTDLEATRRYGHRWAMDRQALALLVPSAIIPVEFNLLLNPLHPEFETLQWSAPQPFAFDVRLIE